MRAQLTAEHSTAQERGAGEGSADSRAQHRGANLFFISYQNPPIESKEEHLQRGYSAPKDRYFRLKLPGYSLRLALIISVFSYCAVL